MQQRPDEANRAREQSPAPAEPSRKPTEDRLRKRPDLKGQDHDGGMPAREYDMYRDIPGERAGG